MIPGKNYLVAVALSCLYTAIFLVAGLTHLIIDEGVHSYIIASEFILAVLPLILFLDIRDTYSEAFLALGTISYVLSALLFFGTMVFFPLIFAIILTLFLVVRQKGVRILNTTWIALAAFLLMISLSGILRVVPVSGAGKILAFSIYNNEIPAGVPVLFYDGIIFQGPLFVYTFSIPTFAVYSAISTILSRNYVLIYRTFIRTKIQISSLASGAATVLSCQCEGITGTLPSIAALAISVLILPVLAEGVVLVAMTLFVLVFVAGKNPLWVRNMSQFFRKAPIIALGGVYIIMIPLLEIILIAEGFLSNATFFFGINLMMFPGGMLLFKLAGMAVDREPKAGKPLPVALVSSVLMVVWLVPPFVSAAETNAMVFIAMNFSMIVAGVLAFLAYQGFRKDQKILFLEYLSMMFAMTGLVVLYLSTFSGITIWSVFTFQSQLIFSLILVAVSLPIMWFITNLSLIRYAAEPAIKSPVHPY